MLFQHFVLRAAARYGREPPAVTADLLQKLNSHSWPGNVRELKNAADRFVLGLVDVVTTAASVAVPRPMGLVEQVDQFERSLIENELARHHGSVKATIEALGIPRKTFYDKLRRHGLTADDFR